MIDVKILKRQKGTAGNTGGSRASVVYGESAHAQQADKAKEAEYAERADRAATATEATRATRANYADRAGEASALSGEGADQFLSAVNDDTAAGLITFEKGIRTKDFIASMSAGHGAAIDALGNAEVESIKVRSAMEVLELVVNRLSALEGDQLLTESDTIETVTDLGDGVYRLKLREKWSGYYTAMRYHSILKGVFNTLASGSGEYYTSWMLIDDVDTAENEIDVILYDDDEVPGGKNYPPCELMRIARFGHTTDAAYQQCLYLSSTEGRIVKLRGVNSPIIGKENYGTVLGTMPEFLSTMGLPLVANQDYLYARGLVVQDFIQADYQGHAVPVYVDRGSWVAGASYYGGSRNPQTGQYEISEVWLGATKYRCKTTGTTAKPAIVSDDWEVVVESAARDGYSYSENLLLASGVVRQNSNYNIGTWAFAEGKAPKAGDEVTVTIWGELGEGKTNFAVYNSGGTVYIGAATKIKDGVYRLQATWKTTSGSTTVDNKHLFIYTMQSSVTATSRIDRLKVEIGYNNAPVWTPATAEMIGKDGKDGENGKDGERGPALRGPQAWSDLPMSHQFYEGAASEDYKDVVYYNGYYYSCIKSHTKNALNYPGSSLDETNGYWQLASQMEMVASRILLAEMAYIDNLGVRDLRTADTGKRVHISHEENAMTIYNAQGLPAAKFSGESYDNGDIFTSGTGSTLTPTALNASYLAPTTLKSGETYSATTTLSTFTTANAAIVSGSATLGINVTGSYTAASGALVISGVSVELFLDGSSLGSTSTGLLQAGTQSSTVQFSKAVGSGSHTLTAKVTVRNPRYSTASYSVGATATFTNCSVDYSNKMSHYFANGNAVGSTTAQFTENILDTSGRIAQKTVAGAAGFQVYNGEFYLRLASQWYRLSANGAQLVLTAVTAPSTIV